MKTVVVIMIRHESVHQASLANATITQDNDLEQFTRGLWPHRNIICHFKLIFGLPLNWNSYGHESLRSILISGMDDHVITGSSWTNDKIGDGVLKEESTIECGKEMLM